MRRSTASRNTTCGSRRMRPSACPGYLLLPDASEVQGPAAGGHRAARHRRHQGRRRDRRTSCSRRRRPDSSRVAIDGRFHGERTKAGTGAAEYNAAIARAFRPARATRSTTTPPGTSCGSSTTWQRARTWTPRASGSPASPRAASKRISPPRRIRALPRPCRTSACRASNGRWTTAQWRARIATIQDGFDARGRGGGQARAQRGLRARVLRARGARHRWPVRRARHARGHRAAAACW